MINREPDSIQRANSQIEITKIASVDLVPNNFSSARKTRKCYEQVLAQKMFEILISLVPDADEVISVSNIALFLKYLRQRIHISIEEDIIALALLQKFSMKQVQKGIQVLRTNNIGTMLVILIVIAIKTCRGNEYQNQYMANMFKILPSVLNESETSFLLIIDNQIWIEDQIYSSLFDEIRNIAEKKVTL
ncbi:MAG: hypothetical protein EZS28_012487 [Streblomastix strix]|uniref:Uncharacterized protein n=1 Tax=Streblomastix strix TaxID=222440 RepID=A0A5J4WAJ7_9EUKA|nr:MAG: hypothetical protein EZS28_012487 [Streblomastix strix]